jgi:hypothetical protein
MIASRKRLRRSPKQASREVAMRTWSLSVKQERAKERVPTRRVTVGATSQPRKKGLSKIKCFACHETRHYTSQCPEKKKGKGKSQQVATSAETQLSEFVAKFESDFQLSEFVAKFESDFSLVSCLSANTVARSAWYLDSGASRHMTEAHELFNSSTETTQGSTTHLGPRISNFFRKKIV